MLKIPKEIAEPIKHLIFLKADEFCYTTRSRKENGRFMDELVEDEGIGKVLLSYMPKERIRTYIKDGVLNAYTKQKKHAILSHDKSVIIIKNIYNQAVVLEKEENGVSIFRSQNKMLFILSRGTILKWETALRKALDMVAKYSNLTIDNTPPEICLHLAALNKGTVDSDKTHIEKALAAINVKVWFAV